MSTSILAILNTLRMNIKNILFWMLEVNLNLSLSMPSHHSIHPSTSDAPPICHQHQHLFLGAELHSIVPANNINSICCIYNGVNGCKRYGFLYVAYFYYACSWGQKSYNSFNICPFDPILLWNNIKGSMTSRLRAVISRLVGGWRRRRASIRLVLLFCVCFWHC